MDVRSWTPAFWLKNEEDCLNFLKKNYDLSSSGLQCLLFHLTEHEDHQTSNEFLLTPRALTLKSGCKAQKNHVPYLNVNDTQFLAHNSLVKFRAMIQDMYNPEYYMEKYEVINEVSKDSVVKNGKYVDSAEYKDNEVIDFDSPSNVTSERYTFVGISIPAVNSWVEIMEVDKYRIAQPSSVKSSPQQVKRPLEADGVSEPNTTQSDKSSPKKQCVNGNAETNMSPALSQEHILNFPLPGRTGKACHLKIYEDADSIKINDIFEFVGFLSVDPILTHPSYHHNRDADSEMEIQTHNPPPSLVPRIHCVYWKKLEHCNPLVVNEMSMELEKMQFLRKEVHMVLTQLLLGDALAANYLLCHLLSSVYSRKDLLALGKFSLNISNVPISVLPHYTENLYRFMEALLPKSHYLPMTLENMNELAFTPKKDYDCNRLTSGLLQLSNGTHLVLDETKLSSGKLNESGVKAVGALSAVIKNQKLAYDFKYYHMEFDCDIPFLVLSEGKSFLPSDCHVVLKPDEVQVNTFGEIIDAMEKFLKLDLLNEIRAYLTIARMRKYELGEDVQKLIEDELVKLMTQENTAVDDLHNLMVLARLVCLSQGKTQLDEVCWRRTCEMEAERKLRLKK